MHLSMKNILFLALALVLGLAISSCGGDNRGCTDPTSANYDPEAEEDDSSCTSYNRDKFYGSYLGTFLCTNALLKPSLDNDSLMFSVKEPVAPTDINHVILVLQIDGLPVELNGSINGNSLIIDDTVENLSVPDFPIDGVATIVDVTGLGNSTLSSDEQSMAGELKLTLVFADGSGQVEDTCGLTGNKL